jgi:RNA polymerase sigma-70 factor (ECF subfamily)
MQSGLGPKRFSTR